MSSERLEGERLGGEYLEGGRVIGQRPEGDDATIICRCEDVSLSELRALINRGYHTVDEVKRLLRVGMGPCQGRTCGSLIQQEIARLTGTSVKDVLPGTYRPPSRGVRLGAIAAGCARCDASRGEESV